MLGIRALQNVIIVVLLVVPALVLLGSLNSIQYAEGAVSWNGFLKQVGFNPPSVYEVSDSTVIKAGETENETLTLLCDDGDWLESGEVDFVTDPVIFEAFLPAIVGFQDTNAVFIHDPASLSSTGNPVLSKRIGYSVLPQLVGSGTPLDIDVTVTATILCNSPSSMMTVGGEWQATDTTALIIGYSVLNAYWIAPIGIGIGVGIYLVKRRF